MLTLGCGILERYDATGWPSTLFWKKELHAWSNGLVKCLKLAIFFEIPKPTYFFFHFGRRPEHSLQEKKDVYNVAWNGKRWNLKGCRFSDVKNTSNWFAAFRYHFIKHKYLISEVCCNNSVNLRQRNRLVYLTSTKYCIAQWYLYLELYTNEE